MVIDQCGHTRTPAHRVSRWPMAARRAYPIRACSRREPIASLNLPDDDRVLADDRHSGRLAHEGRPLDGHDREPGARGRDSEVFADPVAKREVLRAGRRDVPSPCADDLGRAPSRAVVARHADDGRGGDCGGGPLTGGVIEIHGVVGETEQASPVAGDLGLHDRQRRGEHDGRRPKSGRRRSTSRARPGPVRCRWGRRRHAPSRSCRRRPQRRGLHRFASATPRRRPSVQDC